MDVQLQLDRSKRFDLRDLSRFTKDMEQATGRICDMVASDRIEDVAFARRIEADRILACERSQARMRQFGADQDIDLDGPDQ